MTSEEWNAIHERKFKAKTGMTLEEWLLYKYTTVTPFEVIAAYEVATRDNEALVKDLQDLGFNHDVMNALLEYIFVFYGKGFDSSLVLEIGKEWVKNNIITLEKAINYMKEQNRKKFIESRKR